jgi:hypothetical protein
MRTHDLKRLFKISQRLERVCIQYQTETPHSWRDCGKLTSFEVERPPFPERGGNWHRMANIKLVFDDSRVYWAFGLDRFANKSNAENFVGLVGTGFEGQYVYLRFSPPKT